ncbi:PH domain-like [Phytophthora cactorum]|nr:PH domain-like [Phytophthora cactorum]
MQLLGAVKGVTAPPTGMRSSRACRCARGGGVPPDDDSSGRGGISIASTAIPARETSSAMDTPPAPHDVAVRGSMPLRHGLQELAAHVAVRYGDTSLFARSKYAGAEDSGGYVGTFEGNPQKQDELACIHHIAACGPNSLNRRHVVVLVDADGRVWNNKMGVGPRAEGDDNSSESSDEEDNFLFFGNLAKTTKTMAETTFGKPTQVELHLATAALRTMGKQATGVCTSARRFLEMHGRGKTILFEMHGQELPTIKSIDVKDSTDENGPQTASARVLISTRTDVEVGSPLLIQDTAGVYAYHATVLKARRPSFLPCGAQWKAPMRVLVRATRALGRKKVDIRGTFRGTYRQIFKLSCGIVLHIWLQRRCYSRVWVGRGTSSFYVGLAAAVVVFLVEVFFLNGEVIKATERYEATLAWRKEVMADSILSMPQPHYDTIKASSKARQTRHPLYIEKVGSINIPQLKKLGVSQDTLFKHYLFAMEFRSNAEDVHHTGRAWHRHARYGGEVFEFIRRCTGVMQRHYPQRSFKIFIVNVPSWFGMAWKGHTAKTNILTEIESAAALLEVIDADNLPIDTAERSNSSYQLLQQALVKSVLECKPFDSDDLIQQIERERSGESRGHSASSPPVMGPIKRETSATAVLDQLFRLGSSSDDGFTLDGVDDEGFSFTTSQAVQPIWHRQLFILHPQFLRFAKTLDSEIYQIVSLTHDTIVQKTTKQNNSFEIITPLMAANGHSLLLYAPTAYVLNNWMDAISAAIDQLKLKTPPAVSPERSPIVSPRAKQEASPATDNQPTNATETTK